MVVVNTDCSLQGGYCNTHHPQEHHENQVTEHQPPSNDGTVYNVKQQSKQFESLLTSEGQLPLVSPRCKAHRPTPDCLECNLQAQLTDNDEDTLEQLGKNLRVLTDCNGKKFVESKYLFKEDPLKIFGPYKSNRADTLRQTKKL